TREPKNLPGTSFAEDIEITSSLERALKDKEMVIFAVPSLFTRSVGEQVKDYIQKDQILLTVSKGIEEKTLLTMSQILEEIFPENPVAVLSGPSHAEEVSRFLPTTIVCAAAEESCAKTIQKTFQSDSFRVYINKDVLGVEIGAALKNVIALAAGIADGLGYGDNTKAALITRGIAEIARLGQAMGGHLETFAGLSGIGDLIVTCASKHSRNRKAGFMIGEGLSYEEAMKEVGQVVEGVYAAKAALALGAKYGVDLPIVHEVNRVLFEGKNPKQAVMDLMLRDSRAESPGVSFP
ncbi:MAG: NAD(P)-dependent glycerol-3-phosphate dehydrogenase, partial [Oribacterium sinus]|nr:NAD(P)-dependent glycerol-3-phosphate dehydrogenase [Oribacterium sinus]